MATENSKKNKILFIIPPIISFNSFIKPASNTKSIKKKSNEYGCVITDIPLGVLSLSSYAKKIPNVEVKLIDFNIVLNKIENFEYDSFKELFDDFLSSEEWLNYSPDIIGISTLFTPSYYSMLDLAECCKNLFPKAMIFSGGGVPTNMYKEIFRDSNCIDAICYGEGEKPLLGLLKAENKAEYLKNNSSWITKEKVQSNEEFYHDFIEDLDEIPPYDYDILNIKDYEINPTIAYYVHIKDKTNSIQIMASRGCPHHCCFCSSHTIHGRKMRYHSIKRVKEDLTRLKEIYGAKTIIFQDDHFMADKKRAYEIIEIMNELKLSAFFPNALALYTLDKKMLEALKSVGVNQLVLSVESGSNRVLKEIMHKPLDLSIVKRVANDCRELGIYSDINILIGLPGETKQDIDDALSFLKTTDANWFRIFCATPLVGSEMFDICVKNNYLKGSHLDGDYKSAVIETEDFTPEYIQERGYLLNLELNFIFNSDFRLGNYEVALNGFENAIKAKNDHALAYYFAAKCYKKLKCDEKYLDYKNKYERIIEESDFWKKYFNEFKLAPLEEALKLKG